MIFSGLTSRIPDSNYARFLPGNVNYELNFNKVSEVKLFPVADSDSTLEMLGDLSSAYGRQKSKLLISD